MLTSLIQANLKQFHWLTVPDWFADSKIATAVSCAHQQPSRWTAVYRYTAAKCFILLDHRSHNTLLRYTNTTTYSNPKSHTQISISLLGRKKKPKKTPPQKVVANSSKETERENSCGVNLPPEELPLCKTRQEGEQTCLCIPSFFDLVP